MLNTIIVYLTTLGIDFGKIFNFQFRPESLKETLPIMLIGMVGIFLVIGVIVAVIYGINAAFSKKKK